jgi:hypothetical protein
MRKQDCVITFGVQFADRGIGHLAIAQFAALLQLEIAEWKQLVVSMYLMAVELVFDHRFSS